MQEKILMYHQKTTKQQQQQQQQQQHDKTLRDVKIGCVSLLIILIRIDTIVLA